MDTLRYDRLQLKVGHRVPSPVILIQHDSTILVPPAYFCEVSAHGNILIRRSQ